MKKFLIITVSLGIVLSIAMLMYNNILFDFSKSKTPNSTGAIPLNDTETIKDTRLLFKLADMGDILTPQFKIHVTKNLKVEINVFEPFDVNKQVALGWLNENGFGLIKSEDLIFFDSLSPLVEPENSLQIPTVSPINIPVL